ncbi:MAG: class poly(R)-hydroxyalkanoic acid synthase, partial [Proteobacteria bacterium]|nr:class poly(R)-hydroxyalkanoic acid synthase [Pseudomonadota bacterium]
MAESSSSSGDPARLFTELLKAQGEAARQIVGAFFPPAENPVPDDKEIAEWAETSGNAAAELQGMWLKFQEQQALPDHIPPLMADPAQWLEYIEAFY